MKTFITIVLILALACHASYSQDNADFNSKLSSKFTTEELQEISKAYPDSILFLNYIAEKGYYFIEFPKEKEIPHKIIENITLKDLETFNIFNYNIEFLDNKNNYYKLGNTGKLLVVVSMKDIRQFSKQQKQIK